jgi:hypothetical protein
VAYLFRGCKVTGCYCVKRAGRLLIDQALFPGGERSLFTKWAAFVAKLDFEPGDVVLEVVAAAQFRLRQTPSASGIRDTLRYRPARLRVETRATRFGDPAASPISPALNP